MKVVTPKEMAVMDRHTIAAGTPGVELMERAGHGCAEIIKTELDADAQVIVLCGPGNNGGDGLVIGRLLIEEGFAVHLFLTETEAKLSEDSLICLKQLDDKNIPIRLIQNNSDLEDLSLILKRATLVVDAIFGTGLAEKEMPEKYHKIFDLINGFEKKIVAIDIPSGLRGDIGLTIGNAIFADKTIVIQNYKTGCLLNDGPDYAGETVLIDIGIDENSIPNEKYYTQENDLKFPQKRKKNTHKYDYGSVVVIAGSKGMSGAGILSVEGALKSGGGLVTCYVPHDIYIPVVARAPAEALVKTYDCNITSEDIKNDRKKVILIGPGIGRAKNYSFILEHLLEGSLPVVIDADGLHHLAVIVDTLKESRTPVVITPHFAEFSKLIDVPREEILKDPVGYGQKFAMEYHVVVVLKGYRTMVFGTNGEIWFNSTGNPGMATGGSGDVLAGMIAGIAGQNVDLFEAARAGVFYHGKAGDYYAKHYGQSTLTAHSIIESLKYVLK
ncbi:NAD(P)H-hydrate dehydratase [Acetobacterium carbinolicum]|jgi:NAD(P)H-hydrate epimerase|uniref:NAD(P)H-hydrate dehydratase n=1 Tax=Acetobacterium TaxID=33951 RepID=UPI0029E1B7A3|nr:NAD(P)H-hydrate dehydratase [Acetobacterium sp. K1/6]MDK2941390.1 ADP-dependent NAD(P)H-hydrate dehydratase / NAD(P)H-hydrate epimerase [Acetobacterium sp.]MDZ5723491.1 NAD(P)H-hydrate dehydratase [Acetobacterium sp. K1/6]